ncbi:hypothetical protein DPMN_162983 [Dreissena polymorpha]|uniref:Uncharacterized protein n=1 Tax=Dreissena polymorpha TaxID=45954 RepID=A0A9D4IQY3_DREPO|nr:hypothetical protein DPMN_162983 [Dreissena polymorpha]
MKSPNSASIKVPYLPTYLPTGSTNFSNNSNRKPQVPLQFHCHVFQQTVNIKEHGLDIIKTNVVNKFHEDFTTNMTSRVLTRKTAPPPCGQFSCRLEYNVTSRPYKETAAPPGGHIRQKNDTSRVLTRKTAQPPGRHFHEDWTIIKTALPPGRHVLQWTGTIFELS